MDDRPPSAWSICPTAAESVFNKEEFIVGPRESGSSEDTCEEDLKDFDSLRAKIGENGPKLLLG